MDFGLLLWSPGWLDLLLPLDNLFQLLLDPDLTILVDLLLLPHTPTDPIYLFWHFIIIGSDWQAWLLPYCPTDNPTFIEDSDLRLTLLCPYWTGERFAAFCVYLHRPTTAGGTIPQFYLMTVIYWYWLLTLVLWLEDIDCWLIQTLPYLFIVGICDFNIMTRWQLYLFTAFSCSWCYYCWHSDTLWDCDCRPFCYSYPVDPLLNDPIYPHYWPCARWLGHYWTILPPLDPTQLGHCYEHGPIIAGWPHYPTVVVVGCCCWTLLLWFFFPVSGCCWLLLLLFI